MVCVWDDICSDKECSSCEYFDSGNYDERDRLEYEENISEACGIYDELINDYDDGNTR